MFTGGLPAELPGDERPEQQEPRQHEEDRHADVHALEQRLHPLGQVLLHPRARGERRVHEQHHRHPEEPERVEAREVQGGPGFEPGRPDLLRRPSGRAHVSRRCGSRRRRDLLVVLLFDVHRPDVVVGAEDVLHA